MLRFFRVLSTSIEAGDMSHMTGKTLQSEVTRNVPMAT